MLDTANKVKSIISENLEVTQEKVKDQARFVKDLEENSLDIVELVMVFLKSSMISKYLIKECRN